MIRLLLAIGFALLLLAPAASAEDAKAGAPKSPEAPPALTEKAPEAAPAPSRAQTPPPANPSPLASAEPVRSPAASKPNTTAKAAALAPELAVLRTSWHPSPDRRLARVRITEGGAPREMREGETEGALHVMKIEPSAVVFMFQGREIRRSVGK